MATLDNDATNQAGDCVAVKVENNALRMEIRDCQDSNTYFLCTNTGVPPPPPPPPTPLSPPAPHCNYWDWTQMISAYAGDYENNWYAQQIQTPFLYIYNDDIDSPTWHQGMGPESEFQRMKDFLGYNRPFGSHGRNSTVFRVTVDATSNMRTRKSSICTKMLTLGA